ncbi:hypothetical protein HAX54_032775 [Datura stramonium]|uniref:Uncharacterized protein n=1 Tax=Datura stramonium TaxID=4076 RepID=A0ABS8VCC6_DATST|nr:hypothetical protein [Datura stramonium]
MLRLSFSSQTQVEVTGLEEEDVDIIVHYILGGIDSFRRNEQKQIKITPQAKQEEFKIMVSEAAETFPNRSKARASANMTDSSASGQAGLGIVTIPSDEPETSGGENAILHDEHIA